MKTLVRTARSCQPVEVAVVADTFPVLIDEATAVLGYKPDEKLSRDEELSRNRAERSNEIRQALRELDDPPFDPRSVVRYKWKMHQRAKAFKEWLGEDLILPAAAILFLCNIVLFVAAIVCSYLGSIAANPLWATLGISFVSMITSAVIGCALLPKRFVNDDTIFIETKTKWNAIPIHQYHKPIPEFALQTAVDLKKRFGDDVSFVIEELEVSQEERVVSGPNDPFFLTWNPGRKPEGGSEFLNPPVTMQTWNTESRPMRPTTATTI